MQKTVSGTYFSEYPGSAGVWKPETIIIPNFSNHDQYPSEKKQVPKRLFKALKLLKPDYYTIDKHQN